jgi:hypothetical protein
MAAPLAVCAGLLGLNVPQVFELFVQVTDQFTPAFVLSPETLATMLAVALVFMAVGGGGFSPNAMDTEPEGVTVTFVVTNCVGSNTDVAWMVTLRLVVTVCGAV